MHYVDPEVFREISYRNDAVVVWVYSQKAFCYEIVVLVSCCTSHSKVCNLSADSVRAQNCDSLVANMTKN